MQHPGSGLFELPEAVGDKGLLCRFEELLDLPAGKFPPESGLGLGVEVALFALPACFGDQLDMPVIQRVEHPAEDIEELIVRGVLCDSWSVGGVLLFPVDLPELEEWIPFVEGLPRALEILFGIAIAHGGVDLCITRQRSPQLGNICPLHRRGAMGGEGLHRSRARRDSPRRRMWAKSFP